MKKIITLLIAVICVSAISGCSGIPMAGLIANAKYPEATKNIENDDTGYGEFAARTAAVFLNGEAQNKIYCPINMYLSLGAVAEITDGTSRAQILDTLGADDIETLRKRAYWLGYSNHKDEENTKCVLSGAVWLNDALTYKKSALDTLSDNYFMSSYSGKCGSEQYNRVLRNWLNARTDGLLQNSVSKEGFSPETLVALSTVINFKAKWSHDGYKMTEKLVFHAPDGDKVCDCLPGGSKMPYLWGEKFACIAESFENNFEIRFILPDEGVTPEELLTDEETVSLLGMKNVYVWEKQKRMAVITRIPKFDISYDAQLTEGMKALGITDALDIESADFSPLTDEGAFISSAKQASRVIIDETGCRAVSYQKVVACGACAPEEELEEISFVLNRPFIFEITGRAGHPLFIGIVSDPCR